MNLMFLVKKGLVKLKYPQKVVKNKPKNEVLN